MFIILPEHLVVCWTPCLKLFTKNTFSVRQQKNLFKSTLLVQTGLRITKKLRLEYVLSPFVKINVTHLTGLHDNLADPILCHAMTPYTLYLCGKFHQVIVLCQFSSSKN